MGAMDRADHTIRRSFEAACMKLLFLWRVDMNFLSQIFPERSAHRDGLDLFLGFRVHFREGDIDDLEQKCLAEIVLVLRSLSFYRVTDRTLLVETFSADQ